MLAGLLVELEALGGVLEGSQEWQADAAPIRSRQLRILSLIASRYLSKSKFVACPTHALTLDVFGRSILSCQA